MSYEIGGANSRFPNDDVYKKRMNWVKALKESKNKYEKVSWYRAYSEVSVKHVRTGIVNK